MTQPDDMKIENAMLRGALYLAARALKDYQDAPAFEIDDGGRPLLEVIVPASLRERAADALARAEKMLKQPEEGEREMKYLRPTLQEVDEDVIIRYVPSEKRRIRFTPVEILAMYDHALAEILDLSVEGVETVQAEARWLKRYKDKKAKIK